MRWPRRRQAPMSCREVGRLLHAFLDGELCDTRAIDVADHLDGCLACGPDADGYRWLKQQLAAMTAPEDPARVDELRRFADQLVEQDG